MGLANFQNPPIKNENFKYYSVEVSLLTHRIWIMNGYSDLMPNYSRCINLKSDLLTIIKKKYKFTHIDKDWHIIKNKLEIRIDCDYLLDIRPAKYGDPPNKIYFLMINYH